MYEGEYKMKENLKLSIIIPVYNEEKTLLDLLKKVEAVNFPISNEIILVDDYSTDGTRAILKEIESKYKIIYHHKNQGKGSALRTGFKYSTGDIITIQDADLEYDPEEFNKLLIPILARKTKVVYGSRFLGKTFFSKGKWFLPSHYIGNKLLSLTTSILYFRKITDMETCYKMFTREVLSKIKLKSKRFDFEPEITSKIIKAGYKIKEIPINYFPRSFEHGKKITWVDGIKALLYLLKYRFVN
jgi:glycosyltransferase involved in cell wall biosynthesis